MAAKSKKKPNPKPRPASAPPRRAGAPSRPRGLGRGLDALMGDSARIIPAPEAEAAPSAPSPLRAVPVSEIRRNPFQPRRRFDPAPLAELVASIRESGVLQPLTVRPSAQGGYELIAGERRLRAAGQAGLTEVPVVVREVTDQEALELALIENLQREDLNPIEEAEGYRRLAEEFSLTQDEVADKVGKSRPAVANALRLLLLPDEVKEMVADGRISTGHAKVLLGLDAARDQIVLARRVVAEGLSVRRLEQVVKSLRRSPTPGRGRAAAGSDLPESFLRDLTERLHQALGTKVLVTPCRTLANGRKIRGQVVVEYHSADELGRLMELLGIEETL